MRRLASIAVVAVIVGGGCGMAPAATEAPAAASPTPTAAPALPTATATQMIPIVTATFSPTDTPTSTPGPTFVRVEGHDVTCRFGPGMEFASGGTVLEGEEALVEGQSASGQWLAIDHPRRPGKRCWVETAEVVVVGETASLPVLSAPFPYVSRVTVVMSPSEASIPCGTFPYTFDVDFEIEVTGPTTVTFRRMLSDGHVAPAETVVFTTYGVQSFSDYYRVGEVGTHTFSVHVSSPNVIVGEDSAEMTCTP